MAKMDNGYTIGIYVLTLIAITMSICVINWVFTFYQLWSSQSISIDIRRPKSVLLFGILCTLSLLIRNPIQFFLSLNEDLFYKMYFIQNILLHFTTIGMVYILVYRTWIVYYDIKWNQALQDEQWQSQINTDTLKQSWFIKNRQIYRNPKYVIIILFIPWFIFMSIGSTSVFIQGRSALSLLFYAINLFTPIFCLLILACKMPTFDDYYKLRKETKMLSIISSVCLIGMVFFSIALSAHPGEWKWIGVQLVHISLLFILAAISYYWVFKQFNLPIICCKVNQYTTSNKLVKMFSVHVHSFDVNGPRYVTDVLKDDELFDFYARHLCKEFCIENLLFFLEAHQLMQYIIQHFPKIDSDEIDNIELSAKNIPKSTIVQDLKDEKSISTAAINLFLKYIDNSDAYFLINISSEARSNSYKIFGLFMNESSNADNNSSKKELMNQFMTNNNVTPKQIYDAFYQTRLEVFQLLSFSFARFKSK